MTGDTGVDRRGFLRNAGAAALLGAVGVEPALAADAREARPRWDAQAFDFDEPYSRVGTDCTKWDGAIATYGEDLQIGMGIADLDFRAAPCITQALAKRCEHENWGYLRRPEEYVDAIVEWNRSRYGLDIDSESLTFTTGVQPGLIAALQTLAPPRTRVLLTTPTYSGFYSDLRVTSTVAEESQMKVVEGKYSIDFEDFERRARRSNAFILCNPQNPTGNCWSPEDLTRMGEICLRHGVVVLSDEIHCDFVTKGHRYTPFASLANHDIVDNSITFKSASKTFSLSAMKIGWYFSTNPDLLGRVRAHTRADISTLGYVASHAAITEGEPWLDQMLDYIDQNHDFVESYTNDRVPHVKYRKAEGTYLAWLDVSEVVERIGAKETAAKENEESASPVAPEDIVQRWLVKNSGVYLTPGDGFGTGGADHMRMNLGTSRGLIERALENMANALANV